MPTWRSSEISCGRSRPPRRDDRAEVAGEAGRTSRRTRASGIPVNILGYCGILRTPGHPGFRDRFIPSCEREEPPHHFVDLGYPACWWRGRDGIDREAVRAYFPGPGPLRLSVCKDLPSHRGCRSGRGNGEEEAGRRVDRQVRHPRHLHLRQGPPDGLDDGEARERGLVAAIMGAKARLGHRGGSHQDDYQAAKQAAEKKKRRRSPPSRSTRRPPIRWAGSSMTCSCRR